LLFKSAFTALALGLLPFTAQAQDFSTLVNEDFLRETFPFAEGDSLKYAECEVKTVFTCTYIWGAASDRDATLASLGRPPSGNKVMLMYAETGGIAVWPRIANSYSDGEEIAGLGQAAIWSAQRGQLSFMSPSNVLVHVNVGDYGKEEALATAAHLLTAL